MNVTICPRMQVKWWKSHSNISTNLCGQWLHEHIQVHSHFFCECLAGKEMLMTVDSSYLASSPEVDHVAFGLEYQLEHRITLTNPATKHILFINKIHDSRIFWAGPLMMPRTFWFKIGLNGIDSSEICSLWNIYQELFQGKFKTFNTT